MYQLPMSFMLVRVKLSRASAAESPQLPLPRDLGGSARANIEMEVQTSG